MEIIHVTAECYPVAKAGGLGDVAGALPKYLNQAGHNAKVIMPMYRTKFLENNEWDTVHEGHQNLGDYYFKYAVIKERTDKLGFELYLVDIFGLLDREKVYGYDDDTDRFIAFQIATLDWISKWSHKPDVIHCHDHHTGLIPFMMKYSYAFQSMADVPSVFTIHNGQYQGQFGWERSTLIPEYDPFKWGMLEWNNSINPLASAVKCAWKVTTVSPSYLDELRYQAAGLESLMDYERGKCVGILNGIDADVWDPSTDPLIAYNFDSHTVKEGKRKNKKELCNTFGLDELRYQAAGLESLMDYERGKCVGILNGIDADVWDPSTDPLIAYNFDSHTVKEGKRKNKKELCNTFGLDPEKPLITFIGRLVGEKAADVLPDAIRSSIYHHHGNVNFLILGSGEPDVENRLREVQHQLAGFVNTYFGYNEGLAHLLYAGADFLLMPSRVEPCGLNQMYALRYGTVPMVRSTGGLKDTVKDFGDWQGYGIRFNHADAGDIVHSVGRAIDLYYNKRDLYNWMRSYMMHIDNSWEASTGEYIRLYQSLK